MTEDLKNLFVQTNVRFKLFNVISFLFCSFRSTTGEKTTDQIKFLLLNFISILKLRGIKMNALWGLGVIFLILLVKKLFHRIADDAPPAKRKNDAASSSSSSSSSSATQECDSSSSESGRDYEVFLSFRGETRTNFTDHLYHALDHIGIHTFRDDEELRIGEKIAPALLSAIRQSKIAIIIFSKGYASSRWCLLELAEIAKCREQKGQRQIQVLPVFYHVYPSEVRNQRGRYGNAFQDHEKKFDKGTVEGWKKALTEIGELKGWDLNNTADG